jgi:plastocyanin
MTPFTNQRHGPTPPSIALLGLILAVSSGFVAAQPNAPGVIEGTVTYQADSKRPWRYARYYVKHPQSGELAEAVVAIRAKAQSNAQPRQPQTTVIDQKNFLFLPETVAVRRGDAVKFTNSDQATHNVRASSDIANFNVNMPGGGSHTVTLEKPGGLSQPLVVGCVFHSAMRAWVFVFDHSFYQVTKPDGRFRLENIPAGDYDLEMAHPSGELRWRQKVTVQPGQTTRVDIRVSPDDKR